MSTRAALRSAAEPALLVSPQVPSDVTASLLLKRPGLRLDKRSLLPRAEGAFLVVDSKGSQVLCLSRRERRQSLGLPLKLGGPGDTGTDGTQQNAHRAG